MAKRLARTFRRPAFAAREARPGAPLAPSALSAAGSAGAACGSGAGVVGAASVSAWGLAGCVIRAYSTGVQRLQPQVAGLVARGGWGVDPGGAARRVAGGRVGVFGTISPVPGGESLSLDDTECRAVHARILGKMCRRVPRPILAGGLRAAS